MDINLFKVKRDQWQSSNAKKQKNLPSNYQNDYFQDNDYETSYSNEKNYSDEDSVKDDMSNHKVALCDMQITSTNVSEKNYFHDNDYQTSKSKENKIRTYSDKYCFQDNIALYYNQKETFSDKQINSLNVYQNGNLKDNVYQTFNSNNKLKSNSSYKYCFKDALYNHKETFYDKQTDLNVYQTCFENKNENNYGNYHTKANNDIYNERARYYNKQNILPGMYQNGFFYYNDYQSLNSNGNEYNNMENISCYSYENHYFHDSDYQNLFAKAICNKNRLKHNDYKTSHNYYYDTFSNMKDQSPNKFSKELLNVAQKDQHSYYYERFNLHKYNYCHNGNQNKIDNRSNYKDDSNNHNYYNPVYNHPIQHINQFVKSQIDETNKLLYEDTTDESCDNQLDTSSDSECFEAFCNESYLKQDIVVPEITVKLFDKETENRTLKYGKFGRGRGLIFSFKLQ